MRARSLLAVSLAVGSLVAQAPAKAPLTRKLDVVDTYFGTQVPDPYRWLEDDNSLDTKAWVEAQNKVTTAYLEQIPERKAIQARLTKLWNYEKYGTPFRGGAYTFYTYNTGLQNQSVLYVTRDLKDPGRVLLDPNLLSKDGSASLAYATVSEDGRYLAYGVSEGGSDWTTWRLRDVTTGQDLPDVVKWSKFSGASWAKDGSGFYYARYDTPTEGDALKGVNKFQKVYFHKVGTSQDLDRLVFERKDQPDWGFGAQVSDDGRWLVVSQHEGTEHRNRVFLVDLTAPGYSAEPFLDAFDAGYTVIGNEGDTFFVQTDKDAPRNRLVAITRGKAEAKHWKELVPQAPGKDVLVNVDLAGNRFVTTWMSDASERVRIHGMDGRFQKEVTLPALGTVGVRVFGWNSVYVSGRRKDPEAFFSFTSFTYPTSVYRLDLKSGKTSLFKSPKVDFDPTAFETKQVFYPSKDGTKIPMFLVHRKGLRQDASNPTFLYGYGGFNVPLTPGFNVARVAWLEMGGVLAVANLRGGGEYGKDWHDAGRLSKKQNVFDDFIAAGEWLIANRYTQTAKLAINGASNGGLLVGACLAQRPDLFGAAIPEVGVMDMLRYHKFTIGWAWKSDYDCSENREGFQRLMTYSPVHALKPGTHYPATLVMTSDHDDRVVPAHSHKFTATLQAAQAGPAPILTRIETNAGHGAGKPTAKTIAERADVWAFLVKNLGMTLPSGFNPAP